MKGHRKETGAKGEEVAAEYLERNGYRLLSKNYSCRFGEIDMVAMDRETLVFVEVRSCSGEKYGPPEESITRRKQLKLRQLAWHYLKAEGKTGSSCRFDVISVLFGGNGDVKRLEHIENAF
ncbi:MAG TPA: YraN family protein [Bacillota bacterium]|nr:YraN family protein [Bacillota bacterium]